MIHDMACHLASKGHRISLVAPAYWIDKISCSTQDGIKVYWFRCGRTKNINKIQRAFNESSLSLRAYLGLSNLLRQNPHDLIVYYSPSIFWGPLIAFLKYIWKCPSYLILRDIFPQWAVDSELLSKYSPVYWYFKLFELSSYKTADRIGVLSPGNRDYFDEHFKKMKDKIEVLYNWAPTSKPDRAEGFWRKRLGLGGKVLFFFGRNIGHAQDMMNIMKLADNLRCRENAHFLLVGEGDEVDLVKHEITARKLNNVSYHPGVPPRDYYGILDEVDIGLFSLHRGHRTHNIPGKLLGYMQFGIPILGSVNAGNDIREIIEGPKAGLISINGDDDAFTANAMKLLENRKLRDKMGENGRKLLRRHFSIEQASK